MMVGRDFVEKIDKTKAKRGKVVLEVNDVSYGYGGAPEPARCFLCSQKREILGIAGVEETGSAGWWN